MGAEELIPQTQKKNIRILKASFLKDVVVTGMPDGGSAKLASYISVNF